MSEPSRDELKALRGRLDHLTIRDAARFGRRLRSMRNVTPEQVQELAARAEQENPGIIDQMSRFYAQNPTLVKSLGGAALAIALGQMSQRRR